MKEKPILFSTQMVQAILEGRKTMTRRVVSDDPTINGKYFELNAVVSDQGQMVHFRRKGELTLFAGVKNNYGQIGDILWVRETFSFWLDAIKYKADGESVLKGFKYKPSIHMPKKYARIWLKITDVKVERLHDISQEDAIAEGIRLKPIITSEWGGVVPNKTLSGQFNWFRNPVDAFKNLWFFINGRESWEANPWVWVISFEVLSTNGKLEKP